MQLSVKRCDNILTLEYFQERPCIPNRTIIYDFIEYFDDTERGMLSIILLCNSIWMLYIIKTEVSYAYTTPFTDHNFVCLQRVQRHRIERIRGGGRTNYRCITSLTESSENQILEIDPLDAAQDRPEGLDPHWWNTLVEARNRKIQAETEVKKQMNLVLRMQKYLAYLTNNKRRRHDVDFSNPRQTNKQISAHAMHWIIQPSTGPSSIIAHIKVEGFGGTSPTFSYFVLQLGF